MDEPTVGEDKFQALSHSICKWTAWLSPCPSSIFQSFLHPEPLDLASFCSTYLQTCGVWCIQADHADQLPFSILFPPLHSRYCWGYRWNRPALGNRAKPKASPIAGYKSQTACREWSRQFVESSRNKDGKWQLCITYIYSIISSWNISLYLVDKTTLTRKCCWKLDDSWWFHMIPIRTIIFSSFQSHSEVTECFTHPQASGRVGGSCLGKTVWKLNGLWCLNIY